MLMATVRLQMANGHEVYFRARRSEIHRLVLSRHQSHPEAVGQHIITTEKNVPITVDLQEIQKIHIM